MLALIPPLRHDRWPAFSLCGGAAREPIMEFLDARARIAYLAADEKQALTRSITIVDIVPEIPGQKSLRLFAGKWLGIITRNEIEVLEIGT